MSDETPPDNGGLSGPIGAAMGEFVALAASGGFAVNDHGGQALLNAIREMLAWIDSERFRFDRLIQRPMLGSSTNAEVMKPFMLEVSCGDVGFVTQVLQLEESLLAGEQAILQAMASYRESDEKAADRLGER
ncbi:hypothetical protein [Actinokineospora globicatena]|uniref:hypothetical protein n=1 Tax=Actinokineospora globicatena TaxID=103729 RepID=UPI0020A3E6F7|nr:hypothetical protein [Actinokineospora globicatena]MCP2304387.1 hypothetical protein [Actinokineospora globicatena]